MKLAIWGTGSLGKEILSMIRMENHEKQWEGLIFIDDKCQEKEKYGLTVYTYDEFKKMFQQDEVRIIIATGEPLYRYKLAERVKKDQYMLGSYFSQSAFIGERTILGEGTVVFPNVYLGNDTHIGLNCIIHCNAKVESEIIINNSTFVSSGAFVGANTSVGCRVFVGPNAALFDHIMIGDDSIIGMGSVVIRNVENRKVFVGNPARFVKDNLTGRVFDERNCCVVDP